MTMSHYVTYALFRTEDANVAREIELHRQRGAFERATRRHDFFAHARDLRDYVMGQSARTAHP